MSYSFPRNRLAVVIAGAIASQFIANPNAMAASEANAANKQDKIIITGSRIKRTEVEGAATVISMTSEEMQQQGFTTLYEALSSVTSATGSFVGEQYAGGFQPNAQAVNFRGLGAGRTLYLLDGKRIADYPAPYNGQSNFVNLSHIPLAMVERVEIMAGGASAIYGSDAMAGVVNIITRSNLDNSTLSVRFGDTKRGGGENTRLQWFGGKVGKGFENLWALEFKQKEAVTGADREYVGERRLQTTYALTDYFNTGNLETTADVCAQFTFQYREDNNGSYCVGYPDRMKTLANEREGWNLFDRITFEQGDYDELYLELHLWQQTAHSNSGPLFFQTERPVAVVDDQFNLVELFEYARYFSASEFSDTDAEHKEYGADIQIGFKGFTNTYHDYEISLSHSFQNSEDRLNLLKEEAVTEFFLGEYLGLNSINNVPVDVYTNTDMTRLDRPLTEAEMDQIIGEDLSKLDSSITTLSFTLSGDMFDLGDSSVQFAAVVEASKKSYEIDLHPRTLDTTGEGWYGRTGTEGKGSRTSYGAGLETLWPITDNLKLTLAGRYDKYDDQTAVDDAWTYNIGLEYRPTDSLLIRSTSSSNFRAPDMHLVYANSGGAFYPGTDVYAITSGSLELEEETGTSHTLGVVYEPMDNLSLSVDLYQLELDGLVEFENPIALRNDFVLCQTDAAFAADNPELCLMVNDRVSFANGIFTVETYPVNTSYQKQRGIDSSMRYRLEAGGAGVFTFTANHTNVLDSEKQPFVGAEVDTNWRNNRFNNDLRSRFRSSVNWELSDWRVTLMSNRLGTISSFDSSERLDSWTTYNLTAGYTFDSNLTLEVIINNLTDEYPRLENTGVWPYFNHQHYNAMGRAWSVEARLEF